MPKVNQKAVKVSHKSDDKCQKSCNKCPSTRMLVTVPVVPNQPDLGTTSIYAVLKGNICPDEPVILFVHGLGTTSREFSCLQDAFCSAYATLAIDLRGFGRSTLTDGALASSTFSYTMFIQDIKNVLDSLQIRSVIFVGVDFGASIGISFTSTYPEYVEKLVISGANLQWVSDGTWPYNQWTVEQLMELWDALQDPLTYPETLAGLVETYVYPDLCPNNKTIQANAIKNLINIPLDTLLKILGFNNDDSFLFTSLAFETDKIAHMTIPLLILVGSAAVPSARQNAGHFYTQWAVANAQITEFLFKGINGQASDVKNFGQRIADLVAYCPGDNEDCCDTCK